MSQITCATWLPCFTMPRLTGLHLTWPRLSWPRSARRHLASPCPTQPRLYQPSQTNSRQLGGMIPSLSALATIPLCLKSARKTWQRRHSVLRLLFSLPASLPLLMWSMWHLFKATGSEQWTHRLPSRSQTCSLTIRHSSFGNRVLGIHHPLVRFATICAKRLVDVHYSFEFPCYTVPYTAGPYPAVRNFGRPNRALPRWSPSTESTIDGQLCYTPPSRTAPSLATTRRALLGYTPPSRAALFVNREAFHGETTHANLTTATEANQGAGLNQGGFQLTTRDDRLVELQRETSLPTRGSSNAITDVPALSIRVNDAAHIQVDRQRWLTLWHRSSSSIESVAVGETRKPTVDQNTIIKYLQRSGNLGENRAFPALDVLGSPVFASQATKDISRLNKKLAVFSCHHCASPFFGVITRNASALLFLQGDRVGAKPVPPQRADTFDRGSCREDVSHNQLLALRRKNPAYLAKSLLVEGRGHAPDTQGIFCDKTKMTGDLRRTEYSITAKGAQA